MRLGEIECKVESLDPVEARIAVHVRILGGRGDCEIRGRIVGPRCKGSSTVEISYPLHVRQRIEEGDGYLVIVSGVIPEPNLWDSQTPFEYVCMVELREGGAMSERKEVGFGLRMGEKMRPLTPGPSPRSTGERGVTEPEA